VPELSIFSALTAPRQKATGQLASVESRGGWWPIVREPWAGAWQHNVEITLDNVLTHPTLFAVVTRIATDVARQRLRLVQQHSDHPSIWTEVQSPSFSPVLRRPNHYQIPMQFIESWVLSKCLNGNTYVLLVRDNRRVVQAMYVLDPQRVRVLVAPNGDVYYQLKRDDISQLPQEAYTVPATEIIHDRYNCLFHPLVGVSPIYASGLAAVQGLNIQNASTVLFANGAQPGGILVAPGAISKEQADRIKAYWDTNFAGDNAGKVAVLSDDMKYTPVAPMKAVDSQLVEQLDWVSKAICEAFGVPLHMVMVIPSPTYNNVDALNRQYQTQTLHAYTKPIEDCLDFGLGLTTGDVAEKRYGTEFDVDDLMWMDVATRVKSAGEALTGGLSPNEVRARFHGLGPVDGGETPYMQEQNWPLRLLADREIPTRQPTAPAELPPAKDEDDSDMERAVMELYAKAFTEGLYDPALTGTHG
jgi:HK97 family phage portal protein